ARAPEDMVVVDLAGDTGDFSPADIATMRRKPDGSSRLVLAYLSIGEAETYRWYWSAEWARKPPAWLGRENPQWPGNYTVRFWHPEWQAIIFDYIDRIVAAGFDGVYLDRVDVFEQVGHDEDMVTLVERLAQRAREQRQALSGQGFVVISQNGD